MLNCVGHPLRGYRVLFLRDELPRYENIGTQVILSISGSEPVHYAEIAELVGDDPRIAALEMNLSCPNVGSGLPFLLRPAAAVRHGTSDAAHHPASVRKAVPQCDGYPGKLPGGGGRRRRR